MKFIYLQTGGPDKVANPNVDRGYFGPRLIATCDDFELDEKLETLAEENDMSNSTLIVQDAYEYKASTIVVAL